MKKSLKNPQKSVKKHLRTIILPLQGLQEGQHISKRRREDHFIEFWGSPGTPLGSQKSPEKQKNGVRKLMKNQKDSKEPPKADLDRSGVARSCKMRSKMSPKWYSTVKKLIFAKVHISSALPMREGFRDLKKSSKIIKKSSNFMMKTDVRKKEPSETDFWCFWPHFGVSWGPRREPKMQKRGFRRISKKHEKKRDGHQRT